MRNNTSKKLKLKSETWNSQFFLIKAKGNYPSTAVFDKEVEYNYKFNITLMDKDHYKDLFLTTLSIS